MGIDSTLYQIVLLLHIAASIVGFGGVIAHSAYNAKAFAGNAGDGRAILRATAGVSKIAEYAIYGVFLLGIVLVAVSDSQISFSEAWISGAFVVWFLLVGVFHGLVRPTVKSLLESAESLSPETQMSQDPAVLPLAKKLALGEGLTQLLLVVALFLMIWQPGA